MEDKNVKEAEKDSGMVRDDSTMIYGSADAIRLQGINVLWSTQDTSILSELVDCLRQKMQELTSPVIKEKTHHRNLKAEERKIMKEYAATFSPEAHQKAKEEFFSLFESGKLYTNCITAEELEQRYPI